MFHIDELAEAAQSNTYYDFIQETNHDYYTIMQSYVMKRLILVNIGGKVTDYKL